VETDVAAAVAAAAPSRSTRLGAERVWLMSSCRLLNPDMPGQSDMLMSFTDVTAERAAADKVMFYASHDALTKLPNRASVLRKINRALAAREEHGKLRAALFIDIDDLKATNDTLGHTAGDDVLRSAAQCLERVMSDGDVAGRLGGDELVVLVCRAVSRRELNEIVERLRTELRRPTAIGPTSTPIHASVGFVEGIQPNSAPPTGYCAMPTLRCMRPSGRTDVQSARVPWLPPISASWQ